MVRKNRGRDIAAACGQLAIGGQKDTTSKMRSA
jgi:adenine C2-methylase RlmN of 23S rRNA A2503 and tRNA A37